MYRQTVLALAFGIAATIAHAAPIEGNWRTESGANANIAKCGDAFCINLTSGEHAGKRIGRVSGSGDSYKGEVTNPADGKTYSGSARISGNTMKLKGCVARVICRTQTWARR